MLSLLQEVAHQLSVVRVRQVSKDESTMHQTIDHEPSVAEALGGWKRYLYVTRVHSPRSLMRL